MIETITAKFISETQTHDWFDVVTLITSIVCPIITFYLGYIVSGISLRKKHKIELEEYYKYFRLYLNEQKPSIKEQITHLNRAREEVTNSNGEIVSPIKLVVHPFFMYQTFNKEKLLAAFEAKNKSSKELIELLSNIELTISLNEMLGKLQIMASDKQTNLRLEWNQYVMKFEQNFIRLITFATLTEPQVASLRNINDEVQQKYLDNNAPYYSWIEHYYKPIGQILKNIQLVSPNEPTLELIVYVRKLEHISSEFSANSERYLMAIDSLISQFSKVNLG